MVLVSFCDVVMIGLLVVMVRVRLLFAICRFGRVWCVGLFVILVRVRVIGAVPTLSKSTRHYNPSKFSTSNGCKVLRIYSSFYP